MKKSLLDVFSLLRADLEKLNPKTLRELLALIERYFPLRHIAFVSYQYFYNILRCVGFYLSHPVFKSIKWLHIINSVGHDNAHSSFVIGLGNGFESLLSSRIPYLHSNFLAIDLYGFDFEIDTFYYVFHTYCG